MLCPIFTIQGITAPEGEGTVDPIPVVPCAVGGPTDPAPFTPINILASGDTGPTTPCPVGTASNTPPTTPGGIEGSEDVNGAPATPSCTEGKVT